MVSERKSFLLILLMVLFSHTAWAQKTDIVYLKNGDRITGEVKNLSRGKLELSTDHMGTVFIEWDKIQQLISNTGQSIELTDGQRYYGWVRGFSPRPEPSPTLPVIMAVSRGKTEGRKIVL